VNTHDPVLVSEPLDANGKHIIAYRCPSGCRFNAYMYAECPEHGARPVATIVLMEVEEGVR
jgi:hypothetical protein